MPATPSPVNPPITDDPLLDVPAAASYLGDTERHVRDMAMRRQLAYTKIGGKLRFLRSDLDALVRSSRVEASS